MHYAICIYVAPISVVGSMNEFITLNESKNEKAFHKRYFIFLSPMCYEFGSVMSVSWEDYI